MALTLRLLAGEPAWCSRGTHIIGSDNRVVYVSEDCDVTFEDERAFRLAEKMVEERRTRMKRSAPVDLPAAGPVGVPSGPPEAADDLKNTMAALLARIEELEKSRGG